MHAKPIKTRVGAMVALGCHMDTPIPKKSAGGPDKAATLLQCVVCLGRFPPREFWQQPYGVRDFACKACVRERAAKAERSRKRRAPTLRESVVMVRASTNPMTQFLRVRL